MLLSLSVVGAFVDMIDCRLSIVLAAISTMLSLLSLAKGFGGKALFYSMQSKRYLSLFSRVERPDAIDRLNEILNEFDGKPVQEQKIKNGYIKETILAFVKIA